LCGESAAKRREPEDDVLLPDRGRHLGLHQGLDRRAAQQLDGVVEDLVLFRNGVLLDDQGLRCGQFADRGARIVRHLNHANVFRMVGNSCPVEGGIDLYVVAQGVLDGLALEVLLGVARIGSDCWSGRVSGRPTGRGRLR